MFRKQPDSSTGTAEIARGILRVALGGTMIAHGVRHGTTLEGTAGWFKSIGFREPMLQAQASAVIEIGSGAALIAGAATPLSASAVVGTMAVAAQTVHLPNGYFVVKEGWEYVAFISAAAVALSSLGAGRFSVDRLFGWDEKGTPAKRAALTAGLGLAGAAVQLKTFWTRPTPSA
jgi:putative oxidoreductase